MKDWRRRLETVPEIVAGSLTIAVTFLILLAVVLRYVFNDPLSWSEEAARVLFMWLGFLGAALALQRGKHVSVPLLVARLGSRQQAVLSLFSALLTAVISVVLLVQGLQNTRLALLQRLPLSELSMGWLYSAVPVAAALMVLFAAAETWRRWRDVRGAHGPAGRP